MRWFAGQHDQHVRDWRRWHYELSYHRPLMGYYKGYYDQHCIDRARWLFALGYYQGKFALHMNDYDATKGIDMTSVRSFADLNDKLSRSVAINAMKQAIVKLDVLIEGMQRTMQQFKEIKDKLETYERKES